MKSAIIGYTGYVGSTLCQQANFSAQYNSANIEEIKGKHFDLLVCAGAPAAKWKANQNPTDDLANIQRLICAVEQVTAENVILISTVDVYPSPANVDESTLITPDIGEPYGKNRFYLEEFIAHHFSHHSIVRLPGLFGRGLKKNFIYDLLHQQCLDLTHCESKFQFYNLKRLWSDLQVIQQRALSLVNLAPEPVSARDIAWHCFGLSFTNTTERLPVNYNMQSLYSEAFGAIGTYLYSATETYQQVIEFVKSVTEKTVSHK